MNLGWLNNNGMDVNEVVFVGCNKYGQAGIGEKYHNVIFREPKSYAFPTFLQQVSCGAHHAALLTIDGHLYTMGSNIHGALGASHALNYSFSPLLVPALPPVSRIDCGSFHVCAVAGGRLFSWGKGIDGQLGHGNTKNLSRPTPVEGIPEPVVGVSCGTSHTLVLAEGEEGTAVYAFGSGIYGQLGTGSNA